MDYKQAKKIRVGARVQIWAETPDACTGTAIEVGYCAVKYQWDDGQVGIIHHRDHMNVIPYYGGAAKIVPGAAK